MPRLSNSQNVSTSRMRQLAEQSLNQSHKAATINCIWLFSKNKWTNQHQMCWMKNLLFTVGYSASWRILRASDNFRPKMEFFNPPTNLAQFYSLLHTIVSFNLLVHQIILSTLHIYSKGVSYDVPVETKPLKWMHRDLVWMDRVANAP